MRALRPLETRRTCLRSQATSAPTARSPSRALSTLGQARSGSDRSRPKAASSASAHGQRLGR